MSEASSESELDRRATLPVAGPDVMRRSRLLNILAISGAVTCAVFLALMLLPTISGWGPYFVVFSVLLACSVLAVILNRSSSMIWNSRSRLSSA